MSRKLVTKLSRLVDRHTSRRGFLRSLVMSATAAAFAPAFLLRPIPAAAAIVTCHGFQCAPGSPCCDGWTEFCCVLTGENTCPPGTVVAGWWKVDNSRFCSYDKPRPRYYIDCNVACLTTHRCSWKGLCSRSATAAQCGCPRGCKTRMADCVQFRYGQCNQDICVGPIRCRLVTCVPPWQWDPACNSRPMLTNQSTGHQDRPCLHDWFTDVPPKAFYADAVRWMSRMGLAVGLTGDLFGPDEPMRWEDFATLLWSYAGRPASAPSNPSRQDTDTDYERAVAWMVQQGIAGGRTTRYIYPAKKYIDPAKRYFDPANEVTRAEAVTFLHRLAGVPPAAPHTEYADVSSERDVFPEREPFPDVAPEDWYAGAVGWAVDRGIVWWSPHLGFQPDQFVKRSEAAFFLHRFDDPVGPPVRTPPLSAQPWL